MRPALFWAGAAAILPAFFLWALAAGASSSEAAAVAATVALIPYALGWPAARPAALALAAGCCLGATIVLLPQIGAGWTSVAGAALAALGWRASRPLDDTLDGPRPSALEAALSGAAAVGSWRLLSFLLGHSLYAAVLAAVGGAAGLAIGRALRGRAAPARRALPGVGPLTAGLAGLLFLAFARTVGLNASHADYVRSPVLGWWQASWLALQASAAMALWTALLGAFQEDDARPGRWSRLSLIGPVAAAGCLSLIGPGAAAATAFLGLAVLGAARGRAEILADRVLSRVAFAALGAAALLANLVWSSPRDIVQNRLNAVFPGGRFLVWREARGTALGVYEFATGLKVLLRDGVADFNGGISAAREAHLPLLARPARRALLVGTLHPETLEAAMLHAAQVDAIDAHPGAEATVAALSGGKAPFAPRRSAPGPELYGTIIVEIPGPSWKPESALSATREQARRWKARLEPGGLLAWRLPEGVERASTRRAAASLRAEFADVALVALDEATLLLAADAVEDDAAKILARLSPAAASADPGLRGLFAARAPWSAAAGAERERPEKADRPLSALPLRLR